MFIMLYEVDKPFSLLMESVRVTTQMKAIEQYFNVPLFVCEFFPSGTFETSLGTKVLFLRRPIS